MHKPLIALAVALLATSPAHTAYPERPVRVIVGLAAGGATDAQAR